MADLTSKSTAHQLLPVVPVPVWVQLLLLKFGSGLPSTALEAGALCRVSLCKAGFFKAMLMAAKVKWICRSDFGPDNRFLVGLWLVKVKWICRSDFGPDTRLCHHSDDSK
jgi:hypothetical protein